MTNNKCFGYGILIIVTTVLFPTIGSSNSYKNIQRNYSPNLDPVFRCENNVRTFLTKHNDGIDDCGDNSDEYTDPLLFYSVFHPDELSDPILRGFFFKTDSSKTDDSFRTTLPVSCFQPWTLLGARGPYLYIICPGDQQDNMLQIWRNGSIVQNISRTGSEIQAVAFDDFTSNAYLLENWSIKMCDNNFLICTPLRGRLRHKPISLTFSSERGLLFWIEEKGDMDRYIVTARRDGTGAKVVHQGNTTDPYEFVTVDQSQHRLWWLTHRSKNIYSSFFNGSDKKLHGFEFFGVQTFAVDDDRLFWGSKADHGTQTCDVRVNARSRCNPVRYRPDLSQNEIGKNVIIQREKKTPDGTNDDCDRSSCSHLCTYVSDTEHTCFCETSQKNRLVSNLNHGFCEGVTLLVSVGNHLYVVGFKNTFTEKSYSPIVRKTILKNLNSVSALAYDSIQGRVILTETDRQNIYTWTLGRNKVELITSDEGEGTINSLEFDEVGNNVYWISPSDSTLKVTSCVSNKTIVVIDKNSSSGLFDFTLAPKIGYMFILSKGNTSINLERISMNGDIQTRRLLYHFEHTDTNHLSLHYMRSKAILILMDRLNSVIKYTEMKNLNANIKFAELTDNGLDALDRMTSLEESVIWTEVDGSFRSVAIPLRHDHSSVQKISLGLPNEKKGPIRIAGVIAAEEFTHEGCDECQDLCLPSGAKSRICRCASESCEGTENNSEVELFDREDPEIEQVEHLSHTKLVGTDLNEYILFVGLVLVVVLIICAMAYKFGETRGKNYELSEITRPVLMMNNGDTNIIPLITYENENADQTLSSPWRAQTHNM